MCQFVVGNTGSVIEITAIIGDETFGALGFRITDKTKEEEEEDRENFGRISIQGGFLCLSRV